MEVCNITDRTAAFEYVERCKNNIVNVLTGVATT